MKPHLLMGALGISMLIATTLCVGHAVLAAEQLFVLTLNPGELIDTCHAVNKWNKKLSLSASCKETGRIAYIESNGKRIVVFNKSAQVELIIDPAEQLKLSEYRVKKDDRILISVGFDEHGNLGWSYNSSQFGDFDFKTNRLRLIGAD